MKKPRIYCDHNATTPVRKEILKTYKQSLSLYGNPSSLHHTGRLAKEALETSRETLAHILSCSPTQLLFCSSGTEANNHVLYQLLHKKIINKKPIHVLVSSIEHSSIINSVNYLKSFGIDVDTIPVDSYGKVNIQSFKQLFKPHTALVSIMMANNEIGTIQNIDQLTEITHSHDALFHCDAIQALGKIPIHLNSLPVDFMSFSSHKIYAPKGVGALFIKDESHVVSLLHGGHHERGLRASTENIPGILAFKKALELLDVDHYINHTRILKNAFIEQIKGVQGVFFNGPLDDNALPNTLNISFTGCEGHAVAMNCDLEQIDISTGSACSVGSVEPSHVLTSIGIPISRNKESLRISFGLTNTLEEIDYIVRTLTLITDRIRHSH